MLTGSTGYKQYDTGRTYMAKMGDWRENKDVELELDGIGGVNILVKADVHRSGMPLDPILSLKRSSTNMLFSLLLLLRHQLPLLCL